MSLKQLNFEGFHDLGSIPQEQLKFAVIVAKYKNKFVFVRHRNRTTWEIPGGTREHNESINKTATRELVEETGAKRYKIQPVAIYGVRKKGYKYYGQLFYADIFEFGVLPQMEISQVSFFEEIPKNLTYPRIQPHILKKIDEHLEKAK